MDFNCPWENVKQSAFTRPHPSTPFKSILALIIRGKLPAARGELTVSTDAVIHLSVSGVKLNVKSRVL